MKKAIVNILVITAVAFVSFENLAWAWWGDTNPFVSSWPRNRRGETTTWSRLPLGPGAGARPIIEQGQPTEQFTSSIFDAKSKKISRVDRRRWNRLYRMGREVGTIGDDPRHFDWAQNATFSLRRRHGGKMTVLTAEIKSGEIELERRIGRGVYEWAIIGHDGKIDRYEIQGPGRKYRLFWVDGWPPERSREITAGMRQLGRLVSKFLTDSFLARAAKCR